MNPSWIFDPVPPSGAKKGGLANAQVFDPTVDSLIRESLQNARDQRAGNEPVRVRIALKELTGPTLSAFLEAMSWDELQPHVKAAAESAGITISARLREGLGQIDSGTFRTLLIEDRGTVGLTGGENEEHCNFNALCRHELVTSASRRESGGSFGIGKSMLWRFSGLSTVLFGSWLSETSDMAEQMRFFGRALLTSHSTGPDEWDGSGWYGTPESTGSNLPRAISVLGDAAGALSNSMLVGRETGKSGTSILILGFDDPNLEEEDTIEDVCETILRSARRWFWPAMIRGEMGVLVEGWRDDEQAFSRDVDPTSPELQPFVETQAGEPSETGKLQEPGDIIERELKLRVPAQRHRPGEIDNPKSEFEAPVRLRVRLSENSDAEDLNRIALQRGSGMVIQYRSPGLGTNLDLDFHAVLEAGLARGKTPADQAAEEFLRAAEPAGHDEWRANTERIAAEYMRGSQKALRELFKEIDRVLRDLTGEEKIESDEGPEALRRLFPLPGVGDIGPQITQRLSAAGAQLDGDRWSFSGTYASKQSDSDWSFRVQLSLDQEAGSSRPQQIGISQLSVDGGEASGPDDAGSFLVKVPKGRSTVDFAGASDALKELPPDGARRVRLRLDVQGVDEGQGYEPCRVLSVSHLRRLLGVALPKRPSRRRGRRAPRVDAERSR